MSEDDTRMTPRFDPAFRRALADLVAWRRDVRRFRPDPVPESLLEGLLDHAQLSPSVGNSQPWRWVRVDSPTARATVQENFRICNAAALADLDDCRARLYATLKLEGLQQAPVQFAVFCETDTEQGHGLGRRTMPEMLHASVAGMIATFWLLARAEGVGVGWVSILDPVAIGRGLGVAGSWELVAYLCIGWPEEEHLDPELVRQGWQARTGLGRRVTRV